MLKQILTLLLFPAYLYFRKILILCLLLQSSKTSNTTLPDKCSCVTVADTGMNEPEAGNKPPVLLTAAALAVQVWDFPHKIFWNSRR